MDWVTVLPPIAAIALAIWTRNVYWALGMAIWLSETLIAKFNPMLGALGSVDRTVAVFESAGNTRILLFCLIIGALIAFMQRSGGISAMVEKLHSSGLASTPRRAGLVSALSGVVVFVETNVSLLASGILGRPLFDRLKLSRERLSYFIDSTCAPISVLILFNGWGAYISGLIANSGVENEFRVMFQTIGLNFYPLITLIGVFATIAIGKTFGPMAKADANWTPPDNSADGVSGDDLEEPPGRAAYMGVPLLILIGGSLALMAWTGGGDITQGSGSQSILWAVVFATIAAYLFLLMSRRAKGKGKGASVAFKGVGDLLPAVVVILLALTLGNSLTALGTGAFLTSVAESIPTPFMIPAILFVIAGITSFTTGTSWGTYGVLVPIAIPMAIGAGLPIPLVVSAVLGGGVFGDHCSPISDTTVVASMAAGCDHMDHVRTQMPYALSAGVISFLMYIAAGLAA